jgi:hypothetical protein
MRHGVDVTSQHHSVALAARGLRDERVAVAGHRQVRQAAQGPFDRVGEGPLRAADRGDVDEGGGQLGAVGVQVKVVVHGDQPIGRQAYRISVS